MSKKPDEKKDLHSAESGASRLAEGVPLMYGDKVIDVIFGVSTSKVIIGLELGGDTERPTLALTMPTAALIVFAQTFLKTMGTESMINEIENRNRASLALLKRVEEAAITG